VDCGLFEVLAAYFMGMQELHPRDFPVVDFIARPDAAQVSGNLRRAIVLQIFSDHFVL
jgi:hypothetical protein